MDKRVRKDTRRSKKTLKQIMQRRLNRYMAIVFVVVIAVITIADAVKKDTEMSEKENRYLASAPALTADAVFSGAYMEDYETYRSDQFLLRDFWVSVKTRLDLLSGKKYANGVYKGKDGYLIEDAATPDQENLEKNVAAINALADGGAVNVFTMVVPNAVSILSQKLPKGAPVRSQSDDLKAFRQMLSEQVTDIDVADVMENHKDEYIYYRTDHHWTTKGAYYAFTKLSQVLGLGEPGEYDVYKVCSDFQGTMASSSGYKGEADVIEAYVPKDDSSQYVISYVEEQKKTASVYHTEALDTYDKYTFFLGGNSPLLRIKTTVENDKRLLIVKDSYANCLIPFLLPYYREIVVVDPRYYYDDIYAEISSQQLTDVLFLYNANTFFEDNSISGVFGQN